MKRNQSLPASARPPPGPAFSAWTLRGRTRTRHPHLRRRLQRANISPGVTPLGRRRRRIIRTRRIIRPGRISRPVIEIRRDHHRWHQEDGRHHPNINPARPIAARLNHPNQRKTRQHAQTHPPNPPHHHLPPSPAHPQASQKSRAIATQIATPTLPSTGLRKKVLLLFSKRSAFSCPSPK